MGVLDFIFPKNCLGCGKEGRYICKECIDKTPRAKGICPHCQHPSIDGVTHVNCQTKLGLNGLTSIWEYDGVVRKAILALKYKYATETGKELVEYLIDELKKLIIPDMLSLVPIPIYWHKQNTRGFNQSVELGGNIAENLRLKFVPDLLIKKISTPPQTELSGKERRQNLKGSFVLNSNFQIPDSVLLFDDVFTTGSTIFEATKVLKRAGVEKVWGLTIAR